LEKCNPRFIVDHKIREKEISLNPDSEQDCLPPSLAPKDENPFKAFLGVLPVFSTREEVNARIQDLREDDLTVKKSNDRFSAADTA
jgi:hypothetical protein